MLRPEKMCRVSVTGSKRAMEQTIEAVHDLDMLHVTEYDGSWDGFEPGNSLTGTNEVSDKLVTVRSLQSILDVSEEDAGPTRVVTDEAIEEQLDEVRTAVNELDDRRDDIRDELNELRLDHAGFLLAAEEKLAIEAQKGEAPLTFATTENAFIAEGWIPNERYEAFERALSSTVGDAVDIDRIEIAEYNSEGHAESHEEVEREGGNGGEPVGSSVDAPEPESESQPQETVADGGVITMGDDAPPVIQDNPSGVRPFEDLVEVVNRPKYGEFDPTVAFFLTFPAFFGFMIGDLGYGLLYLALGYGLYSKVDSDVLKSLGGVGMWAGGFTALFGVLYGEFFGLHQLGEIVWGGSPPMHKGLQPTYSGYALAWLTMSLLAGTVHLAAGWIFDFVENLNHSLWDAITESGSWLLMLFGLWAWVFSGANGAAPDFLYTAEAGVFAGNPYAWGFTGLPAINLFTIPGLGAPFSAWLILFFAGLVLLALADPIEVVEFLNVLVNVLSYTRLAAVLLAKAGMAFVVNLLFFGAYSHHGEFHFLIGHGPEWAVAEYGAEAIMFPGLVHSGIAGALVGVLILVIGHLLVLVLGITSAGLQGVRLEYVEFFGKFFEGGGKRYNPFGYERNYTTED
ncbi:V-type ATP synthase subunit I [Haloarcula marismortui ATCC 43049]|uniref:A-type ATP synthase subunit I n=1 Tax=Haloarcula marismortui (strain ATCC 43049 / DSM 3752 / JCM 8966 / VKM B-1809) TaxID=272569 RepID=Q5UXZ3_HALMA|nr:ATP synthase subunit I [Haloarcula marismortui]AAV47860.1 V-type ATP synthase subunit I [Haloarcula marismortui ATCC 43049]QCP92538.1 V-type ATP synthase subunit I [Haloarcula marismortui ATCC 43049]